MSKELEKSERIQKFYPISRLLSRDEFVLIDKTAKMFILGTEEGDRLEALNIIKTHKLLNYVLKNKKCASMYHLSDEEIETLKRVMKNE